MEEWQSRSAGLLGAEGLEKLQKAKVAVFGVGGVGGYAAEGLARCGVGAMELVDSDTVAVSNINRQIIATTKTVGQYKTSLMAERIRDINPKAVVTEKKCFFLPETADEFDFSEYDYVIDAVDTVTAKIEIILRCKEAKVPVISAMGAGNKLCPAMMEVADIYKTSVCPLAKVMRRELKKRGVEHCKVVYSKEEPMKISLAGESAATPGSVIFTPAVAGLILASEVVKDLVQEK